MEKHKKTQISKKNQLDPSNDPDNEFLLTILEKVYVFICSPGVPIRQYLKRFTECIEQTGELQNVLPDLQVKQVVEVLQKVSKTTDELLDEVADIYMQFTLKKVPKITNKIIKVKLPHGLYRKNTQVCLFVKDLDRKSREHELTEDHFKDELKSKGVKCISDIIPLKALKLEYKPYEAKRNLSQNYDLYLADDRIVRLLPSLLGKNFYGKKRHPIQVNLKATDLKKEITNAVNNTRCIMAGRGTVSMLRVGHFDLTSVQIVENIISAVDQLTAALPGGAANIRNIYIKTQDSMALPLYVSIGSNNDVILPEVKKPMEDEIIDEITTLEGGKVKVKATGSVEVIMDRSTNVTKGNEPTEQTEAKQIKSGTKKKLTEPPVEKEITDDQDEDVVKDSSTSDSKRLKRKKETKKLQSKPKKIKSDSKT